jgi:hypothetical protein
LRRSATTPEIRNVVFFFGLITLAKGGFNAQQQTLRISSGVFFDNHLVGSILRRR